MRRKSSTPHYQTFNSISPPKSKGKPFSDSSNSSSHDLPHEHERRHTSPLPKKQMAILAIIALSEQTAFNSISPYLPSMAASFPDANPNQVGIYVGTIASAFALAQCGSQYFWGWLSDRIGRKPVILIGTVLTAACFVAFGLSRSLLQAVIVQALMGLCNGNQGVVSTCLGEITDRSNQSKAFTYLPVLYGLGAITGPIIGGLLVLDSNPFNHAKENPYPYLLPNLLSAAILLVDLVLTAIFLEESLEQAHYLPPLGKRVKHLFAWIWQFTSSSRPSYLRRKDKHNQRPVENGDDAEDSADDTEDAEMPELLPSISAEELKSKDVLNRDTILLLGTYLIFQLSNVSFNSLYPIFAQADPPPGRDLNPDEIGLSLAFAGGATILFQITVMERLQRTIGNRWMYRAALGGFVICFLLMPWVGYKSKSGSGPPSQTIWLWIEIGVILLVRTLASVSGLTSALLLVCPLFSQSFPANLLHRLRTAHQATRFWAPSTE